ncbi:MAG TPA: sugar phosphate isomerase/epimerase family protein [Thermoanaerobaculia bacterium]|nr:sugar phosphate isomerase/epimerase family protein [Thermoanaerobaculia bacterium]
MTTAGAAVVAAAARRPASAQTASPKARFRTGLVAYSYRQALQSKAMKYEDLINVAVDTGTDGIDMTVYWLPSTDAGYLRSLRHLAYRNRVEIYSIGTRVQLAQPTPDLREKQLADLRKWVEVAQRVGATHIRVFGGQKPADATLEQAVGYAAETLKRGAEIAGAGGVLLGIEDDGGITDFARETIEIVRRADSPYAGMNLDTGNFRPPKVYEQIEMSIPYAVSTHIKTEAANDDGKTRSPADWDRIFKMFAAHGYRGYMGLEYEAADPQTSIPAQLRRLEEMAQKYSA